MLQSELIQRLGACQDFVSLTVLACAVPSFTEANCQSVVQCVTEKCSRVLQDYTSAESMSGGDLYTLVSVESLGHNKRKLDRVKCTVIRKCREEQNVKSEV